MDHTLKKQPEDLIPLDVSFPVWDRFFMVAPLVVIGTREEDGTYDLAPKHMVTPLGWKNYFGFVCTPEHSTYQNVRRTEAFTVSFPTSDAVVLTSLGRCAALRVTTPSLRLPRCHVSPRPRSTASFWSNRHCSSNVNWTESWTISVPTV